MTLHLHGLGHFHPENEITNAFLESLEIGTSDKWIMERVGIRSRRTVMSLDYIKQTRNAEPRDSYEASDYTNAQMGVRAVDLALERAGISRSDVGLVIGGTCAPDTVSPAEACNLARALEIEAPAFDVNSACTSFLAGMSVLDMMQPERLPDYVLLVSMESMTRTVSYDDRTSAVLWGDGALAAVISPRIPGRARIIGTDMASSPAGNDKVMIPRQGFFEQEGRTVQMFGIKKTSIFYNRLKEQYRQEGRPFHFIGHQANLRMLESICARCEIPPELHHSNAEWYGNTGSASSGSVISQSWDKWRDADDIAVVGVGSGLTWASYLLRFGEEPGS